MCETKLKGNDGVAIHKCLLFLDETRNILVFFFNVFVFLIQNFADEVQTSKKLTKHTNNLF